MKYLNILVLLFLVGFSTTTQAEKTLDCSEIIDEVFVLKNCTTTETVLNSYPIQGYGTLPEVAKKELGTKNIAELINKNDGISMMIYEDKKFLSIFPVRQSVRKWSITYHNNNFVVEKIELSKFDFFFALSMMTMIILSIIYGFTDRLQGVPRTLLFFPLNLLFGFMFPDEAKFEWIIFCLPLVALETTIIFFRRYRDRQEIT